MWDTDGPNHITIKVDVDQAGRIKLVLHELIHPIFDMTIDPESKLDGELEEVVVEALSEALWLYVSADSRRHRWWSRMVNQKLHK